MSSLEFPSDDYLDAIEEQTAEAVEADNARLGENADGNVEFDFCKDCPMLGFPQEEIAGTDQAIGGSVRYPGTTVSVTFVARGGKCSKEMLLGTHGSSSISGARIRQIYNEAALRTQKCEGPKRIPPFLGPVALKRCGAIEPHKH